VQVVAAAIRARAGPVESGNDLGSLSSGTTTGQRGDSGSSVDSASPSKRGETGVVEHHASPPCAAQRSLASCRMRAVRDAWGCSVKARGVIPCASELAEHIGY